MDSLDAFINKTWINLRGPFEPEMAHKVELQIKIATVFCLLGSLILPGLIKLQESASAVPSR
jgi:hypothetical protein